MLHRARAARLAPPARRPAGLPPPGFTLVELLVVLLMVALASGLIAMAMRSGDEDRLEQEGARRAALLEAGRAEARATGTAVRFELRDRANSVGSAAGAAEDFRFVGLPAGTLPQVRWLDGEVRARIDGARWLTLGPEPLIGAQRIVLQRGQRELVLATDGLAPFAVLAADVAGGPSARLP